MKYVVIYDNGSGWYEALCAPTSYESAKRIAAVYSHCQGVAVVLAKNYNAETGIYVNAEAV